MLRKALEAFRTSLIAIMEIEAAILLIKIYFDKIYKNYAFRAI